MIRSFSFSRNGFVRLLLLFIMVNLLLVLAAGSAIPLMLLVCSELYLTNIGKYCESKMSEWV